MRQLAIRLALSALPALALSAGGLPVPGPGMAWANASNTLTVHEGENGTRGLELQVPKEDPSRNIYELREVERGRLESAIIKAQRNLRAMQDFDRRRAMLDILEELERRLRMLNRNPSKYFTLYPPLPAPPPETE
ncbi:hypothetical protein [Megalodesulfovibrio paquesii]